MLFKTVIDTITNLSNQTKKLIKIILKLQNFYLKKTNYEKLFFEEKHSENKSNPKELW